MVESPDQGGPSATRPFVYMGASVGAATVQIVATRFDLATGDPTGVIRRQVLSRRRPAWTPYMTDGSLDIGALGFVLLEAGSNSPVLGDAIDGRIAVLSGYAAEPDNAFWTARGLADIDYTPYLCLRAGPHLGAVLAAYGGDAVESSGGMERTARTVLNVDLGASTTKFALCHGGQVLETAALALGTRSIAFDADGTIRELRPAAARAAQATGVSLTNGAILASDDRRRLAETLAACIFSVIERHPFDTLTQSLALTEPIGYAGPLDSISFTGGGAELLFERETRDFGDLGPFLAQAIRGRLSRIGISVREPEQLIRATLLGGMQYRFTGPGTTPTYSEPPAFVAARARDSAFVPLGREGAVRAFA